MVETSVAAPVLLYAPIGPENARMPYLLEDPVLLGATFPLMSAALVRTAPDAAGESLAMLYFTNSLGGAAGVLAISDEQFLAA